MAGTAAGGTTTSGFKNINDYLQESALYSDRKGGAITESITPKQQLEEENLSIVLTIAQNNRNLADGSNYKSV